jgi:hypothetical protein
MDFSKFKLDLTAEEVQEVDKGFKSNSGPKALGVGLHEVAIEKVEEKGPSNGDPSWERLNLTLVASNGGFTYLNLLVPTESLKYGPENKLWAWKKLKEFLKATGYEVTEENAPEILAAAFSNPSTLVGHKYQVELKFTGHHAQVLEDKTGIALVDRDGVVETDEDGDPIVLPTFGEIKDAAKELGLWYEGYPQVVGYGKKFTNPLATKKKTGLTTKKISLPSKENSPFS